MIDANEGPHCVPSWGMCSYLLALICTIIKRALWRGYLRWVVNSAQHTAHNAHLSLIQIYGDCHGRTLPDLTLQCGDTLLPMFADDTSVNWWITNHLDPHNAQLRLFPIKTSQQQKEIPFSTACNHFKEVSRKQCWTIYRRWISQLISYQLMLLEARPSRFQACLSDWRGFLSHQNSLLLSCDTKW